MKEWVERISQPDPRLTAWVQEIISVLKRSPVGKWTCNGMISDNHEAAISLTDYSFNRYEVRASDIAVDVYQRRESND